MTIWTCATCAVEHPDTEQPPDSCAICTDERQYVPETGQRWTSQAELVDAGHRIRVEEIEPDLYSVIAEPRVGIGQRGLLVRTPAGNLLWEPPGLIDPAGVAAVRALGGVQAISASHPHLTGASIQWSHAFDRAPVFVASADRQWIRRPDDVIVGWAGRQDVLPGVTFIQCGGHFAGSSVAHVAFAAGGLGALLVGDTIMVGADRASVYALRSYVNMIPLPERAIRRILTALEPWPYDRIYTGFSSLASGAQPIVGRTLERYVSWIRGDVPEEPDR